MSRDLCTGSAVVLDVKGDGVYHVPRALAGKGKGNICTRLLRGVFRFEESEVEQIRRGEYPDVALALDTDGRIRIRVTSAKWQELRKLPWPGDRSQTLDMIEVHADFPSSIGETAEMCTDAKDIVTTDTWAELYGETPDADIIGIKMPGSNKYHCAVNDSMLEMLRTQVKPYTVMIGGRKEDRTMYQLPIAQQRAYVDQRGFDLLFGNDDLLFEATLVGQVRQDASLFTLKPVRPREFEKRRRALAQRRAASAAPNRALRPFRWDEDLDEPDIATESEEEEEEEKEELEPDETQAEELRLGVSRYEEFQERSAGAGNDTEGEEEGEEEKGIRQQQISLSFYAEPSLRISGTRWQRVIDKSYNVNIQLVASARDVYQVVPLDISRLRRRRRGRIYWILESTLRKIDKAVQNVRPGEFELFLTPFRLPDDREVSGQLRRREAGDWELLPASETGAGEEEVTLYDVYLPEYIEVKVEPRFQFRAPEYYRIYRATWDHDIIGKLHNQHIMHLVEEDSHGDVVVPLDFSRIAAYAVRGYPELYRRLPVFWVDKRDLLEIDKKLATYFKRSEDSFPVKLLPERRHGHGIQGQLRSGSGSREFYDERGEVVREGPPPQVTLYRLGPAE